MCIIYSKQNYRVLTYIAEADGETIPIIKNGVEMSVYYLGQISRWTAKRLANAVPVRVKIEAYTSAGDINRVPVPSKLVVHGCLTKEGVFVLVEGYKPLLLHY